MQIEADFATDKPYMAQLLDKLGFDKNWTLATKKDQQALTQVLFKYKKGLTPKIQAELTAKGIDPALVETISGYARTLTAANVTQEALKPKVYPHAEGALPGKRWFYSVEGGVTRAEGHLKWIEENF